MKRYKKLTDGQWSARSRRRRDGTHLHKIKCCDCGLKHLMQYETTGPTLRFRAWRLKK